MDPPGLEAYGKVAAGHARAHARSGDRTRSPPTSARVTRSTARWSRSPRPMPTRTSEITTRSRTLLRRAEWPPSQASEIGPGLLAVRRGPHNSTMSAAENSDGTVRTIGRPFVPGQSGNPGGRPKGLRRRCARCAGAIRPCSRRDCSRSRGVRVRGSKPVRPADQIRAYELLLAYGWGKPAAFVPIEGADPLEHGRGRSRDQVYR